MVKTTMTRKHHRLRLNKPALFEHLGYEPHPGQLEIHLSEAPRRVVACGVRWGKTMCAAFEGIAAALHPAEQSLGWVVAPSFELCDRVFGLIRHVVEERLDVQKPEVRVARKVGCGDGCSRHVSLLLRRAARPPHETTRS